MHKKRGKRGFRRLNKKAQESLMWTVIFELILVGMALIILTLLVSDLAKNNLVFKQYYAGDIAMVTSTLYAAPGNVDYEYELDEFSSKNFYFQIKDSMVYVGSAREGLPQQEEEPG